MTTTKWARVDELTARYAESKLSEDQALRAGAAERHAIVTELLTFMPAPEVARKLGISLSRVSKIVGGVRAR